jgi:diguanylate cyclase (GGDEF)-like protein
MNWRPAQWKLGTRFAALVLALLLAIQLASFATIRASIAANARASVAAELDVGERALRSLLVQDALRLADASRVLASDFGFRDAVLSGDAETLRDALRNHGGRIGASVSAVLDNDYLVRASSTDDDPALAVTVARVGAAWAQRQGNEKPSVVTVWDGRPTQFVLAPLRAPLQVGWVLMGFALDERLAQRMRNVSALDLALLARPAATAPWTSAVTMLPAPVDDALREAGPAAPANIELAGTEFGLRHVALATGDEGGGGAVRAVLLRSVDDAVRPYERLQLLLAAITLAGVVAFAAGTTFAARRITQPIRRLVDAAQRLGGGDLATPVQGGGRADEIGELAQAFEGMRHNLAGQQAELERLAYWDTLTGLPNRTRFREALQAAIAAGDAAQDRLAVLILDLDRFKHVNDVLGYAGGDRLLQGVGQRLQQAVKQRDTLSRLSGDEFALLLPGCGPEEAFGVAQRIAALLETPLQIDDQTIDLPASIGIACWPLHAADAGAVMTRAELAMYAAKARKSGPQLYDPATDTTSAQTLSLRSELKRAVEHGELRLFLQPKIGIADGTLIGAEALVRWQHPQRGMVPPMQFIPFAEQTGFIRQLTQWVFEDAARQWRMLADQAGAGLRISINLSARDLLDVDLPEKLGVLLERHAAPAEGFCLEITESAIMDDPKRAETTLQRLAERGFKLSIDDYGTGQTSLTYLTVLPVQELKIDKTFVLNMNEDARHASIVRSTIDLSHTLGLSVVAEGVENAAIFNALRRLGCDEAQGYHLSRPMRADAFPAWARRWSDRTATGWGGLEVV